MRIEEFDGDSANLRTKGAAATTGQRRCRRTGVLHDGTARIVGARGWPWPPTQGVRS